MPEQHREINYHEYKKKKEKPNIFSLPKDLFKSYFKISSIFLVT